MNLEQVIRDAPGFQVVKRGETPRESARNVYDLALHIAGLDEAEDRKDPVVMILRAAGCITALITAAKCVEADIHEELGLVGGATGAASMHDLRHLTAQESLKLAQITAAVVELESMKPELLGILRQIREQRDAA